MAKRKRTKNDSNDSGAKLGFEATLWLAADKLRNNLDPAEYKHVVLSLIFLKYISDAFEGGDIERREILHSEIVCVPGVHRLAPPQLNEHGSPD